MEIFGSGTIVLDDDAPSLNYYIVSHLMGLWERSRACIKTRVKEDFFAGSFHFMSNLFAPLLPQI
jgi:hypothetical protein